jgi:hypothetical protein|nr:MAG TPA: hypothetical protein [Caudoviricetes sp.]
MARKFSSLKDLYATLFFAGDTTASVWVERDTKIATGKFKDIAWDVRYRDRKAYYSGQLL